MNLITVFIAEAHVVLRQGLNRFLAQQNDIQVVGAATNGRQLLPRVEALQPHVLLLDLRLLEIDRLAILPNIRAKSPRTKILILADFCDEEFVTRALQHGIQGCVLNAAPPTELVKAIRAIHAGELWVPRRLLTRVVEELRHKVDELQASSSALREALTPREHEVVLCAVKGMTNKEIAAQLCISATTVKTHLEKVFRKLNLRRRGQLSALSQHLAAAISHAAPLLPPVG
jgi:DNA-binding NarL/FixJ family response regulator